MKKHLPPLAIWTGLCLLFFGTVLLGIERLPNSDLSGQFLSFAQFQARTLADGRFPFWSPGSYAGFPFAADTQAAAYYLPRLLTILFSLPWGFSYHTLQIEGIAHIWLAGIFTYALAYDITKEKWGSLTAALAFGLGAYLTSYPLLQLAVLETIIWLPLVLLLLRKGVAHPKRPLPWFVAAGMILALAAFAGHPQTLLHVGYMAAIYYLYLTIRARWQWQWILGFGAVIAITVVGLTAVFWLPTLNYLQLTTRSEVTYEFVAKGQPLINYIELLTPLTHAVWSPEFVGVTTLILAFFALFGCKKFANRRDRSEILFWAAIALLAAWVSLGDKGVLFTAVYRLAPGFSLFRQQERLVSIVSLSMALLAAQGFALWLRLTISDRRYVLNYVSATMAGLLIIVGVTLAMASTAVHPNWPLIWTGALIATLLTLLLLHLNRRSRIVSLLLILLLFVQLYIPSRPILNLQAGSPNVFWPQPAWLDQIEGDAPFRVETQGLFHVNFGEAYGLEDVDGISPLRPAMLNRVRALPAPLRWQLLNVAYITSRSESDPELTELATFTDSLIPGETSPGQLYHFANAFPRAWMTYEPLLAADTDTAFAMMQDPVFNPATQVILQTETPPASPPGSPPTVDVERPYPEKTVIHATTTTPGILVISEWAMPGWAATLNGTPADLLTADGALQGVYLPAGTHTVEITYQLPGLKTGLVLAFGTLLFALLLAWRWRPAISYRAERIPTPLPAPRYLVNLQAFIFKHWRGLIWLTIFLGFVLRVFHLGVQELRGDEAFSFFFAIKPFAEIPAKLLNNTDPHPPLHYLLLNRWIWLTGESEFALRYISLLASLLILPVTAVLGKEVGNKTIGWMVTILLAISQLQIWIAQDVRNQYTSIPLLGAAATLVLLKLTKQAPAAVAGVISTSSMQAPTAPPSKKNQYGGWFLYALLCALLVYTHYAGAFILIGHVVYMIATKQTRRWLPLWIGAGVVALLLFAPWLRMAYSSVLASGQFANNNVPELANYLVAVGVEMVVGTAVTGAWVRWAFIAALLLCVYGLVRLAQQRPPLAALLGGWLISMTLFLYLLRFRRDIFNDYYIAMAAPAFWLLVSIGIYRLFASGKRRRHILGWGAVILLCGANFLSYFNYVTDPAHSRSVGYRQAVAQMAAQATPNDLFIAHQPDPALTYYTRQLPLDYQMQPDTYQPPTPEIEAGLAALTANYNRIWFIPAGSVWDAEETVPSWLQFHTMPESVTPHNRIQLHSYIPEHAIVDNAHVLSIGETLPNGATLAGAFAMVDGQPADLTQPIEAAPGTAVSITLIWQTDQAISENYTAFVHLLAPDGFMLTQHDGIPVSGTRPTTVWQTDELQIDIHPLTVPETAASEINIVVGMYQSDTLQRQPFSNGAETYQIGQFSTGNQ